MIEPKDNDQDIQRLLEAAGPRENPPEALRERVYAKVLEEWQSLPQQTQPRPKHARRYLAVAASIWIAMAAGRSGAAVDMGKFSLTIGGVNVLEDGGIVPGYDEAEAQNVMKQDRYEIVVGIGEGEGEAVMKTCDLTEEYVRINCEYRS